VASQSTIAPTNTALFTYSKNTMTAAALRRWRPTPLTETHVERTIAWFARLSKTGEPLRGGRGRATRAALQSYLIAQMTRPGYDRLSLEADIINWLSGLRRK
jgi:hypothetical protein